MTWSEKRLLEIGPVLRYAREKTDDPVVDGLPNYHFLVRSQGTSRALLESGINPIAKVKASSGLRVPAILISSSPHKVGSRETPWQDTFAPDVGHIRYFGDNKSPDSDPGTKKGNRALIHQFELHHSGDEAARATAAPIVFFRRVRKGHVQFQGFGLIDHVELVTQYHAKLDRYFSNYVFDFLVMDMAQEGERFDWSWVTGRRDRLLDNSDTVRNAPASWRAWLREGISGKERIRRSVVKLQTAPTRDQQPLARSKEDLALRDIYGFYEGRKARFEALAADVVESRLRRDTTTYRKGWITPPGSDGGADFIGRIDIGRGFGQVKLVLLGQAKCEKIDTATGGNHIARTVARLKRGWVGAYVTTSYFSERVQREVLQDAYPLLLINGRDLGAEVTLMAQEAGFRSVTELLKKIDATYEERLAHRQPEEILTS